MIFVLLEVKDLNISLTSEKSVAEHISFRLGQGEMLSIVGSSGAGKTTICKAIMGLLGNTYRADGEILFQGEDSLLLTTEFADISSFPIPGYENAPNP